MQNFFLFKVPIGFQNFLQEIHWNITKLDLTGHLAHKNKTYLHVYMYTPYSLTRRYGTHCVIYTLSDEITES